MSKIKLGNYTWKMCNKCGERYTIVSSKRTKHICKEDKLINKIKKIFKII